MNDRLIEFAKLWGVETHRKKDPPPPAHVSQLLELRPRLDVAHDLLKKLPRHRGPYPAWHLMTSDSSGKWAWSWQSCDTTLSADGVDNFEFAVIALAEMAKP